jgi:acetylornithine/succinyldiaminopimelate/putrescine aminotransferase
MYDVSYICICVHVTTGNGDLYGHQAYDIVPDFMTLAKPLAGGLPIGAVLVSDNVIREMPSSAWLGMHGTTFGANPVVCRAAEVVLDRLENPAFRASVAEAGELLCCDVVSGFVVMFVCWVVCKCMYVCMYVHKYVFM